MITSNRAAVEAMFSPESYGTTLLAAAVQLVGFEDVLGPEADPLSLYKELEKRVGSDIQPLLFDRLMAAISVVTTDLFYASVYDFILLSNVLSGSDMDIDTFDPADPWEMATAVMEASILDDTRDEPISFSEDVRKYMGVSLSEFGFAMPPRILSMAIMPRESNVAYDYADDPEVLGAIMDAQGENNTSINEVVTVNRAELVSQLAALGVQVESN